MAEDKSRKNTGILARILLDGFTDNKPADDTPDPGAETVVIPPPTGPGTVEDLVTAAADGRQFDGSTEVVVAGNKHESTVFRKRPGESLILDLPWTTTITDAVGRMARYTNLAMAGLESVQPTGDDETDARIKKILANPIPVSKTFPIQGGDVVTIAITGCIYIDPAGEPMPVALAKEYNEITVPFYKIIEFNHEFFRKQLESDPNLSKKYLESVSGFYKEYPEYLPQLTAEPWAYVSNDIPNTLGELVGVKTHDTDGTKFALPYLEVRADEEDGSDEEKGEAKRPKYFPLVSGSKLKVYIQITQHIKYSDKSGQKDILGKRVYHEIEGKEELETQSDEMWGGIISGIEESINLARSNQDGNLQPGNNGTYTGSVNQDKKSDGRESTRFNP
ncbi:hypothetical protein KY343_05920 [Candidatus Woesearchaeota archaeon]|nr:hypothetical protein [Candidatus Woesearchaeota archaeon]